MKLVTHQQTERADIQKKTHMATYIPFNKCYSNFASYVPCGRRRIISWNQSRISVGPCPLVGSLTTPTCRDHQSTVHVEPLDRSLSPLVHTYGSEYTRNDVVRGVCKYRIMYRPPSWQKKITPFYFTGRPGPGSRPSSSGRQNTRASATDGVLSRPACPFNSVTRTCLLPTTICPPP